ncbi:GNAT family N-acetyltransferase [Chitinibacter sp. S2-10]|uniref:GNAT family N-acetyltransferase n=1 Tax=Chitinibacter sp. S2-10 TaxID=3373597 RepID=UPI003977E448
MALEIRPILATEYEQAAEVVWASFNHLAAHYQSATGIESFAQIARACEMRARDIAGGVTYIALIQHTIVGVLQVRSGEHISLLFVLPEFQSRGVGRALIRQADAVQRLISVQASSNSVTAYMRYGFMPTGAEQLSETGIRYVPMARGALRQ